MDQWVETCVVCAKRCFSEEEMRKHLQSHAGEEDGACDSLPAEPELHCPFCQFLTESSQEIEKHVAAEHNKEIATPKKDQSKAISNAGGCDDQASGVTICPMCGESNFASNDELNAHVNEHFNESSNKDAFKSSNDELLALRLQQQEEYSLMKKNQKVAEDLQFEQLRDQHGMGKHHSNVGYKKQAVKNMDRSVGKSLSSFDYYNNKLEMIERLEEGVDDGMTTCTNVFELIKTHLQKDLKSTERAWLASETEFIGRGPGDAGWGCGYRNIQMIISSLAKMPQFSSRLRRYAPGGVPSIPKLQEMIEEAWKNGFDATGRAQLESRLERTRKWIGATEAFALFANFGLHCRIADFPIPSGPNNSHLSLLKWVSEYFKGDETAEKVVVTNKPPLYFQHQGHSRSIVGMVCRENTGRTLSGLVLNDSSVIRLIIYDPGIPPSGIWTKVNSKTKKGNGNRTFCTQKFIKPVSSLTKEQYQITAVVGWATDRRVQEQKNVDLVCEKVR